MRTAPKAFIAGGLAVAGVVMSIIYQRSVRPWCLHWGATDAEATRAMAGDGIVPEPALQTTRAVTIYARPDQIWPWLVQMGQGRAGAYTYDWIENLFGLRMHSADRIIPELQHLAIGDVLLKTPSGDMAATEIQPNRLLITAYPDASWSWVFALEPLDETRTRLISRNRLPAAAKGIGGRLYLLLMEPGSLVMERKMLLGIKRRAESLAHEHEQRRESAAGVTAVRVTPR